MREIQVKKPSKQSFYMAFIDIKQSQINEIRHYIRALTSQP